MVDMASTKVLYVKVVGDENKDYGAPFVAPNSRGGVVMLLT